MPSLKFPFLLPAFLAVLPAWAGPAPGLAGREGFVPGEILLRLKASASPDGRIRALASAGKSSPLNLPDLFKVRLSGGEGVLAAVERMEKDPSVQYAQPNYRYYALGAACAGPTDQYYGTGGVTVHNGNVTIGWPFLHIQADKAWTQIQWPSCPPGSASITVAVLDSGISRNHPDLRGVPLDGYNAVAASGVFDSSCSYPATFDSAGVTASMDDFGHGTYVAGLIGALWNGGAPVAEGPSCDNGPSDGMAGTAPGVSLLAVKVLDCSGSGTTDSLVLGTGYAVSMGAKVLNFSLGSSASYGLDPAEKEALDGALAAGCVIVAAAGNESSPGHLAPVDFPAAYPPVIGVGAVDENDQVAAYSNGGTGLDLVAPGGSEDFFTGDAVRDSADKVFSSFLCPLSQAASQEGGFEPLPSDPNFGVAAGTSAATPFVSAAAALVWTLDPSLTSGQVAERIIDNTDSLNGGKGWDPKTGYGRLNLYRALVNGSPDVTDYVKTFNSPNPFHAGNGGSTNITLALSRPAPVELTITDSSGEVVLHKSYGVSDLNQNPSNPQFKSYYIPWDGKNGSGRDVVTGIYFYSVKVAGRTGHNKIALIRDFP
jgi:subtilisin family serine protease